MIFTVDELEKLLGLSILAQSQDDKSLKEYARNLEKQVADALFKSTLKLKNKE